jgi:hypothetical protein
MARGGRLFGRLTVVAAAMAGVGLMGGTLPAEASDGVAGASLAATAASTAPAARVQEAASQIVSDAAARISRVRGMKRNGLDASILVTEAVRRSGTIRSIVSRLDASDVIVYVQLSQDNSTRTARLQFVSATAGSRFVLVTIDSRVLIADQIKLFGHELYHALEVASHPEVQDPASLRALYERIGYLTSEGFETDGAVAAGRQVYAELVGSPRPAERVRK